MNLSTERPEGQTLTVSCRISIKHEVFGDFVPDRSLLFMELLLHNAAEDVISGVAKPSDLCLCSYLIAEGLNAGRAGTTCGNVPN